MIIFNKYIFGVLLTLFLFISIEVHAQKKNEINCVIINETDTIMPCPFRYFIRYKEPLYKLLNYSKDTLLVFFDNEPDSIYRDEKDSILRSEFDLCMISQNMKREQKFNVSDSINVRLISYVIISVFDNYYYFKTNSTDFIFYQCTTGDEFLDMPKPYPPLSDKYKHLKNKMRIKDIISNHKIIKKRKRVMWF